LLQDYLLNTILSALPFAPNEGQSQLLSQLCRFLTEPAERPCFILRGYAGTGKSSLTGAVVRALTGMNVPCVLLAPTGRAAKVLARYSGYPAYTVHKCIYRREGQGSEQFQLGYNNLRHALFIVDEASMLSADRDNTGFGSGCLLDDLMRYVYQGEGNRLMLIGDDAQLPPVGHDNSPALDPQYMAGYGLSISHYCLTEVARQSQQSGILKEATDIRNGLTLQPHTQPDVCYLNGQELVTKLEESYREAGLEETVVLTRSNWRTNMYNRGIRGQLLFRESELENGDRLMVSRNNYYWTEQYPDLPFLANGDMFQVIRLRHFHEMYGYRFVEADLRSLDYDWEIHTLLWLDTLSTDSPDQSYQLQRTLYTRIAEDYPEIHNRRELAKAIMSTPYYNALQVRYAYAITCHKAQGGQWRRVFIDPGKEEVERRWIYTALTRATEQVCLLSYKSEQP